MKTESEYFAARVLDDLKALGLNGFKAMIVRDAIIETAEAKGWPEVSRNAKVAICKFSADMQSVFIDDEGVALLHTGIGQAYQPLIQINNFGRPARQKARRAA